LAKTSRPKHIKRHPQIPSLNKTNHNVTSDSDPQYNCIAYAELSPNFGDGRAGQAAAVMG
jgi:hypothetical protein